ncbi:hypothetical protein ACAD36_00701 [Clavibacter nebraskensis]
MPGNKDEAASEQERTMREFLGYSLSAPMLFAPPEYAKGSSTREPPDLVWMTQDLLLLMNMRSSKANQEKQDDHNFRQLRGWLRTWASSHVTLDGDTPIGRVEFEWGERPVALLSITAAQDSYAEVRHDLISENHVAADHTLISCTLPAEALMHLVRLGGSAVDLAHLIERLADAGRRVPVGELKQWMLTEVESSIETLFAKYGPGPHFDDDFVDSYAYETVQGLRAMTSADVSTDNARRAMQAAAVFNDLTWSQGAEAAWTFNAMVNIVKTTACTHEPVALVGQKLQLGPHWLYLAAYNASAPGAGETLANAIPANPDRQGEPMMTLVSVIKCGPTAIDSENAMFLGHPPQVGTQTLDALLRARGYRFSR